MKIRALRRLAEHLLVSLCWVVPALWLQGARAGAMVNLPPGFSAETVVGGLDVPTAIAFDPSGRMFIAEKGGTVRVFKNGSLLPMPFVTLTKVNDYQDRGLLGIGIDPNFAANPYVYLLYTYENNSFNYTGSKTARLTRWTAVGDVAQFGSEVVLLGTIGGTPAQPSCENYPVTSDCIPSDSPSHSIGSIRWRSDDTLMISAGDGADFAQVDSRALRAQHLDSLGGKILRIHRNGTGATDNPFYNGNLSANRSKVWQFGLRNPFRFSIRPEDQWPMIGDVGWNTWEELNLAAPGANFGWPCFEGNDPQPLYQAMFLECQNLPIGNTTLPRYVFPNPPNGPAAVVGGLFYHGITFPAEYIGSFFFANYNASTMARVTLDGNNNVTSEVDFATDADGPVDFVMGPDQQLYYVALDVGEVRRIISSPRPLTTAGSVGAASKVRVLARQP
jgi:glucose/arabinose dehydrogenase